MGFPLRVIKRGVLGFASTNRLDRKSAWRLVESAASMASVSATALRKSVSLTSNRAEESELTAGGKI
jgi:predicted Zn-dependent protease